MARIGFARSLSKRLKLGRPLSGLALAIGILAGLSAPAEASNQSGNVTSVAFVSGRVLFWLSGTKTGTIPSCDCCGRWEITANSPNGQALMSIIMTAYAQGKQVALSGSGSCVVGSNDTEGVGYIQTY